MLQALSYFTIAALLIFEGFMITTAEPVQPRALPDIVVRLPLSRPPTTTTVLVTPPPPTSTTTTTIPYLIDQQYRYYEKGRHITALQELLGMDYIDGVYGPRTRETHMRWFGSNYNALRHFTGRGSWYTETIDPEPADEYWGPYWMSRPTLRELVDKHFLPEDRALALRIALCESSAEPEDTYNGEVSSALAVGAFQHLARYWRERSEQSGFMGWDIFDMKANVGVAAHLFYTSGVHHWNPSKACWSVR
jgi:hypothetical protein